MQIHAIYDNGGKSWDRYTVLTEPFHMGKSCEALGLSDNCDSPAGFSQWCEVYEGKHLGKKITLDKLPKNVQIHVLERLSDDKPDTWTVTVQLTVMAGDMDTNSVISNAEKILEDITDGTDFLGFNVTDAERDE